jgi:hypothetical protein
VCVYSMIMDHYRDKWEPLVIPKYIPAPTFTKEELDDFRKDAAELKKLLERAKKYDQETGQKDCELESKKDKVRELAKELGLGEIVFP